MKKSNKRTRKTQRERPVFDSFAYLYRSEVIKRDFEASKKSNNIILMGDESFHRVVWFAYKGEKCVGNWIADLALAKAWVASSNRNIPSHLETTLHISSLGGLTKKSKHKELELIEQRMKECFYGVRNDDLLKNLNIQKDRLMDDINVLSANPFLVVFVSPEDLEKEFKIVR